MFAFAPVDDQSHLLFYGYYSDEPQGLPVDMGVVNPEYRPTRVTSPVCVATGTTSGDRTAR